MTGTCVPIPDLDPPWPVNLTMVVVSTDASPPGWRGLAHQVVAAFQSGGHSFPLAEGTPGGRGDPGRKAFLYGHAGHAHARGCLVLADKTVTGYRDASAQYREAAAAERVTRPCVLVVCVTPELRRRGAARKLVEAAAQDSGVTAADLAWAEPFTDSGYLLVRSVTPNSMWIADYR
jgi:GNAT superfamily N-acetyltransferase